ncbi:MAG: hypothetical protein ABSC16_07705 [Candidatus Dormibacteria bacterium]
MAELEGEGGLPDARVATQQDQRPLDQPASEHAVGLGHPARPARRVPRSDLAQRQGTWARARPPRPTRADGLLS